jgi:hypothetical protein
MALNNITFIKGKGGLGRPLPGKDYISGLVYYTANGNLPSGFSTSSRVKQIFSVEDAEALGIVGDYSDETKATGVYTISAAGATGDSISLVFTEPNATEVILGSYVKLVTDTTVSLVATGLTNAINARTYIHGYSALSVAGAISITVKSGLGIYPNTGTPLSAVLSGTIAGSVTTAFTGGVSSLKAVWHYHIDEFFRVQPKGFLWVGFFAIPGTYDFAEVQTMQTLASGDIRQIGVYVDGTAYTTAHVTALQAVKLTLDGLKMPLSIVLAPNIAAVSSISTINDLAVLTASGVSVVIGQDGANLGFALWKSAGKSITTLGATLGTIALANVQEDIAWVGKFNLSDGLELESIAFANGVNFNDSTINATLLDAIDLKRYIFLRKFPNVFGSYFNDDHTAIAQNSDYAYISNNRVIDKAIRGVYASLLPSLNSPLLLNANGTLANSTVAYLESQSVINTDQMVRDAEASAIGVSINPSQNVASTSLVTVAITIVPVGVARNIVINIGFKTSL